MNYQQTLDFLFAQLPMYQRIGQAAYKKDLHNTIALCAAMDNPHLSFKSIHVAGTNGKGSTSHMLASVMREHGYKTGLYTSPHLLDFRERIRVNGEMVSEKFVVDFVAQIKNELLEIKPSFFEITVVMAFCWFRDQKVDIAIIETGLGGRLDSTNVITPELSVITNIGYDHMDMLGDTLQLIAAEKAGIIKQGIPVVIGEYQKEVQHVFDAKAKEMHSSLSIASQTAMTKQRFVCDLKGHYQAKNIKTVRAALDIMNKAGWKLNREAIIEGFSNVVNNTGLLGRWQIIQQKPQVICDTGHNAEGIKEIVAQLKTEPCKTLRIVFGQVAGKDPEKVLRLLPQNAVFYFCQPSIPRALEVDALCAVAFDVGLLGSRYNRVEAAYKQALLDADAEDLIFVGGSTFVVADFLVYLKSGVSH